MDKKILLEVKDLVVEFKSDEGYVQAIKSISFTLYRGETIGIVGESGSGKSVTSLSIMKLIPNPPGRIASGQILYHTEEGGIIDITQLPLDQMEVIRGNEISMIFQEPMTSLNPVYKCGNQVVEAIMLHQKKSFEEAKQITISLFEQVKLPDPERMFNAFPHQLSGGQKQRVMIAMAMSCKPGILIADEPTTALDVTVQKTILQLMNDLKKEIKTSIMFITHDLGVIAEIADRVLVMYKGQIVEQGDVIEIFENPKHPYTKSLLACRPPLNKKLKILPTVKDFMHIDNEGNINEIPLSLNEALRNVEYTSEEYQNRQKLLEARDNILEVKELKVWFDGKKDIFGRIKSHVKAVDGVSFNIKEGETMGLVGESGCGKTTLGKTILRLNPYTSGEVLYKGRNIFDLSKSELKELRKEIQIIFQDPYSSLNPRMTIGNAIMEPMQVHGLYQNDSERKDKVIQLLERVNLLPEQFSRYPHEFSGGQRQRICIARALALNPKFIICDESVSALDVSVQAQVLNLLIELREEYKFSYVFISHDLSVVKFISDRIVVMNQGKIEEMGYSEEVYAQPKSSYTQKLIAAIPRGDIEEVKQRRLLLPQI